VGMSDGLVVGRMAKAKRISEIMRLQKRHGKMMNGGEKVVLIQEGYMNEVQVMLHRMV
jgi:hypothetical protein